MTKFFQRYGGEISPERPGIDLKALGWIEITKAEYIHERRPETWFNGGYYIDCPVCNSHDRWSVAPAGKVLVGAGDDMRVCPLCNGKSGVTIGDLIKFVEVNK